MARNEGDLRAMITSPAGRPATPGAKPGECYSVKKTGPGHFELAKVIPAARKPNPKPAEIDTVLVSAALTPKMNWKQLRVLTRDP
jgi:hypothetical protein